MTRVSNFIHIDEMLNPSRIKWAVWGGCLLVVIGVIGLLNLPISYRVLLGVLAGMCVGLNYVVRPQLVAVSTLDLHPLAIAKNLKRADISLAKPLALNTVEWQLAIKTTGFAHTPSQLWQGYLTHATDIGKLVQLDFCIIEPQVRFYQINLWQDQCTPDTWRQLKTISHIILH